MNYKETLDWMFAQLPMYQQKGKSAYKDKLDNSINFALYLKNPEEKFKSIHVAGTNGKGSSCHMLASILQEAGYKVGLYTSPHLKDFRERIKINGKKIGKKRVKNFIAEHKDFLENHQLSFFEMTVGMAFEYFATQKVDIAVIEVGLGGRLDSTNIITPVVSLITNIGLDHTQLLGDTIEKIALEKAGIIKKNIPVVISETQPETKGIFSMIASQKKAKIIFADESVDVLYPTDLLGNYQKRNIRGVIACLKELKEFKTSQGHISRGLSNVADNTGLLGRWQVLKKKPTIVCDTAHNREGLQLVLEQIQNQEFTKLHMVLGFVNDKELSKVLAIMPKRATYYFVTPNIPRGLHAEELSVLATEHQLVGKAYETVAKGMKSAIKNAKKEDFIYVGGSTFVVAEIV
ncbi:folylpolyglutamate synthase/dihydrofolate synthase family protein [Croceitalea sp. MTPC9]|uniref:bifunctional folylpolyglutamate synthase/dihydrofolate synthase n=1 Tax=unclassified Croceitalea TaxID=2632280 RepID=UPI002B3F88DF|nr:folylpolyglutamate synthase/dihydrofolate synthase family protein [Croceitalea sp. MTPC6]GMN17740.1 folylpolyglutamate synthase/dihydrofolate synthase family protein [Croceitalea sp. MTPC9]